MVLQNYQNFTEMYHLLWTTNRNHKYRISANSFCGNYSLLNLTFDHSTYRCGNYSRVETIRGNTVCLKIQKLVVEKLCCARKYEQWETFMTFKWLWLLNGTAGNLSKYQLIVSYIHCVAKVYAVLPFYDVKCLCSGGWEWGREESHSH